MVRIFIAIILAICIPVFLHARDCSDTTIKSVPDRAGFKWQHNTQAKTLAELNELLNHGSVTMSNRPNGYNFEFFQKFNSDITTAIDDSRKLAMAAIQETDNSNNYVDYLEPSDLNKLPLGLKKKVGNTEVTIAVSSVIFTPKYAELTVFARIKIPQSPNQIFFGVQGIKLSNHGGIIGDAKLVLLGNVAIPVNGNNAALVLKGGMDLNTGLGQDLTFIRIDCNGFKELGVSADVQFPRSLLIPTSANGDTISSGQVKGSFSTIVQNWNDVVASISLPNFQVVGLKDITFNIDNAVFDFSDYRNSPDIVYPTGYQEKYMIAGSVNTWRGVYAKNLSITLPKAFKDRTTSQRVSFGVNNLIIDNNGITGLFYGENILPFSKGTASGWKFSVDSVRLNIEANHLTRAGFGGVIGLPVNKNDDDSTAKKKRLGYYAVIASTGDYVCKVTTLDSLDFDLWKAKVILKPNSYIQLTGDGGALKPEAMLHGIMGITASSYEDKPERTAGKKPVADMKGIQFESLHLTTEAPYVSAQYFGYNGEVKVGNFPVSLSNIALQSMPGNEMALKFNLKLNFHEGEFGGETALRIIGKMEENSGLQSWSYKRLKIDSVSINADIKDAFVMRGSVKFMDDDIIYGDGFDGNINAEFKKGLKTTVAVRAIFGKKDFRYWFFDGKVDFGGNGIPVGPGFNINGFTGGAYYRMKKEGFSVTASPSGFKYLPDSTAGLGVRAGVLFNFGTKSTANGEASFEIAFNKGGGMRYVGLFGMVKVMQDILPQGIGIQDYVTDKFKAIENKAATIGLDPEKLNDLKLFQPSVAAQKVFPVSSNSTPGEQGITAYLGIQYDFGAQTLHGNFDLYINAAGGLLRGAASGNRAGWAVIHLAPNKWYLHAGTPTDRLGIKFGIGSFTITTGSYLMVGQEIPAFPSPPSQVTSILGNSYSPNINSTDLSQGKGFAFGTNISMSTGDLRFLIFYANLQAGLGFDVMIKDWGDAHCVGSTNPIGINGWYAEGQSYAYLQGELGVRVKVGFIKKNIPIIKAGAAVLLQVKMPNPTWVGGNMAINVDLLGGLVKIRSHFKFSFGNDCQIVQDTVQEYDNFKVISSLQPAHQASNVSVLTTGNIAFSIKPGEILEMETDKGVEKIYPKLEYFKMVEGTTEIPGSVETASDGYSMTFRPAAMLKGNTTYKLMAKVTFMEFKYNSWIPISDNGQKVEEVEEYSFTTGNAPDTIAPSLINRMYPFFNQRNVYKDEAVNGFITLKTDMINFFNNYPAWKAKFKTANGQIIGITDATYNSANKKISFALPANLSVSKTYKLEITGDNGQPNALIKPAVDILFTTSSYGKLSQKIMALQTVQPVVSRISSDIVNLQAKVDGYEGFELYELTGNDYTGNTPLVSGEAVLDDPYYLNLIKPLIYPTVPLVGGNAEFYILNRNTAEYGAPPAKAIRLSPYYLSALQSGEYSEYTKNRLPFMYDLVYFYNRDFNELRTQVINYYLNQNTNSSSSLFQCYNSPVTYHGAVNPGSPSYQMYTVLAQEDAYCPTILHEQILSDVPESLQQLILSPFPFLSAGSYKVQFKFKAPDGSIGSTGNFIFNNPIQ